MLIGLGMIVGGPNGANWVIRTLVQNPARATIRTAGRGFRRFIYWILNRLWILARRYPRWAIIVVISIIIVIEIYLIAN